MTDGSRSTFDKVRELRARRYTYAAIAETLQIAKSTVAYHCSKLDDNGKIIQLNILANPYHIRKKVHALWSDGFATLVQELIEEGISKYEIADALRIAYVDVVSFAKCNKIKCHHTKLCGYLAVKRRRRRLKKLAVIYKGGVCQTCGYDKCIAAMDFHHRDSSTKEFNISQFRDAVSWPKIKNELDKCDLLCSNCHRERHYEEDLLKYLNEGL